MVVDFVRRVAITAPITAIAFDDDHRILYTGTCGQLSAYMNVGLLDECSSAENPNPLNLFHTQTIHGIKLVKSKTPRVIIFGGKAVCIAIIQEMQLTEKHIDQHQIVSEILMENLDDLVLDCTMINDTLLIGYAHNFLDVMINDLQSNKLKRSYRVQCAEISALFSLSIVDNFSTVGDGEESKVLVASGTAFGKIILWNFSITSSKEPRKEPIVHIKGVLADHEAKKNCGARWLVADRHFNLKLPKTTGVIFRLQWSKNRGRIASISDDRTVRVWDLTDGRKDKQVFIGWGHISRLWDVVFLGEREDRVGTCSEDGTIKIWDIEKKCCTATLKGHASDIWCLALARLNMRKITQTEESTPHTAHTHTHYSGENLVLFSGGNDCSVKAWPLSSQVISSHEDASASLRLFPIPLPPTKNEILLGTSRRSNGVSAVRLSPSGLRGVVCLCDGGLWLVSFSSSSSAAVLPLQAATEKGVSMSLNAAPAVGNIGWIYLGCLEKDITNADVIFHSIINKSDGVDSESTSSFTYEDITLSIFCAHPDGFLSETKVSTKVTGSFEIADLSVKKLYWAAHKLRTINVWCQVLIDHNSGLEMCYLVSVSVRGVCRVWEPVPRSGLEAASAGDMSYRILFEGSTGKENVATCVLLRHRTLIVGDSKGGITIFTLPDGVVDWSALLGDTEGAHLETVFIPHAHSTELVSCLEPNVETGGFYSAGHDGSFCIFTDTGGVISRLKCLPIKTPDKVFIVGRGDEISYYVGGFLGGLYLVYDIRKGYLVLRLEGGGWKRPHHAVLCVGESVRRNSGDLGTWNGSRNSLPRVIFVCPAPVDKNTVLTYCDSDPEWGLESASRGVDHGSTLKNIPLHLGLPSHGKVSYCGCILPSGRAVTVDRSESESVSTPARSIYLVTGGEDGNVRLFKHANLPLSDQYNGLGATTPLSQGVSTGSGEAVGASQSSQFLQEVNMPGNVAVKAMAFAKRGETQTQRETRGENKRKNGSDSVRVITHTEETGTVVIQQPLMSSGGILIAVGGRLAYSLWEYSLRPPDVFSDLRPHRSDDKEVCESSVDGLSFLTSGSVSSSAEQDHRILSVQCVLLPHWYGTYTRNTADGAARGISKKRVSAIESEGLAQSKEETCSSGSSAEGGDGGKEDVYLIVMGDSRGIITVVTYEHGLEDAAIVPMIGTTYSFPRRRNRLSVVQEFSVHDFGCPILSCDVTTLRCPSGRRQGSNSGVKYSSAGMSNASSCGMDGSDMSENREEEDAVRGVELESESESYGGGGGVESCLFIACLGDTAGIVSVWILAGSIVPCGPNDSTWRVLDVSRQLFSYSAHAMGANTLSMTLRPADLGSHIPSSKVSSSNMCGTAISPAPSSTSISVPVCEDTDSGTWTGILKGICWGLLIVSGGDDQAISICSATLSLSVNEMGIATVSTTHGFRRGDGCSGSAIKGVKVLTARSQCRGATAEEDRAVTTLQRDAGVGEGFLILSAGYDQRLSIWRPLSSILNISQPHYSKSLCRSSQDSSEAACERPTPTDQRTNGHSMDSVIIMQHRDSLLEWRAGMPIHVGDVCALDALMIHTQEPGQDSCNAGTSPLRSEGMSSLRVDDSQTKSTAQAPQGKVSEIAIIVVGEGYQVFTAVLQNHDNRDSGGSR